MNLDGMYGDTVIAKDVHQSDLVSAGDSEHFARGRSRLVRKLPMQNCSTENVHSREAATGCRTSENVCRHRRASNPRLEQTLPRSYPSDCLQCVFKTLELVETLGSQPVFVWCTVMLPDDRVSYFADAEVSVRGSGSGSRRTQVRQVSV